MRVKRLEIKNYIGISEFAMDLGKVNYLTGHKGAGKTSIVEALEKALTNKSRRTEVIRHGEDEATIYVRTDDELEVDRRIRNDKADYLRVRKQGQSVPSTQGYLNKFISGEVFRPIEFIHKSAEEQAKIILNMLDIPWTTNDIQIWFGEIPGVNYEAHILQVLKQIENLYYTQREAINREIKVLEAQVSGIRNELPPNYNGEEWREIKLSDLYGKIAEKEEINKKITAAQNLINGVQDKIEAVKANAELDKQTKRNGFNQQRSDGRDFIQFLNQKVVNAEGVISGVNEKLITSRQAIQDNYRLEVAAENSQYERKLAELKEQHEAELARLKQAAVDSVEEKKKSLDDEANLAKEEIAKCKNSLSAKEQELLNIDKLEEQALSAIDERTSEQINTIHAEVGSSKKLLEETKEIDTEPLKAEAKKVADMQSYLREFDRMTDIIKEKLAPKKELSETLTAKIETARTMPMELLKTASVPIPEIEVDGDGKIRIGGTLLDGLSEGEKLELALRVAKAQAGDLKLICIDGINKINPSDRKWLEEEWEKDDYQYIVLDTTNGNLSVDIQGELF